MHFLLVSLLAAVAPPLQRSDAVLVRAVIDGDTIDVATFGRVRLLGLDAPEVSHGLDTAAPFGLEAREKLASLVLHRWVRLEREGPRMDSYNRHLAYVVREDGLFVNAALLGAGLARVAARLPLSRLAELKRAEAEAQAFRRGIWGATPQIPTSSYTAKIKKDSSQRRKAREKSARRPARQTPRPVVLWRFPFPLSTPPTARSATATSSTTGSITGRSGSSSSSSRRGR